MSDAKELLGDAWGIIANAQGGNWEGASPEWRKAASLWRDKWHAFIAGEAIQAPRTPIEEEQNIHLAWYDEAKTIKTPLDLGRFVHRLLTAYGHDYGTICHAAAAAALAAAHCVNADPDQGGITGFQAGAINWMFVTKWLRIKGPARMQELERMLYPHYEDAFRTISLKTFHWLQEAASKHLAESPDASPENIAHWRSIVEGSVPFGYRIKD